MQGAEGDTGKPVNRERNRREARRERRLRIQYSGGQAGAMTVPGVGGRVLSSELASKCA